MKNIIIISLLLMLSFSTFSQDNPYVENVTVIGEYMPRVQQARKILFQPERKDTTLQKMSLKYSIISSPIIFKTQLKPISPARITGESFQKLYRNYIAVGTGNYATTFFEYAHSSLRHKRFRGSLYFKHLSSLGKINGYPFAGHANNRVGLSGAVVLNNYTITGIGEYNNNIFHYYGFYADSVQFDYNRKDIRQIFHLADFRISGTDTKTETEFKHKEEISYSTFCDAFNISEHQLTGNTTTSLAFSVIPFFQKQFLLFESSGGFFQQKFNTNQISFGLINIKPYIKFEMNELEVSFGGIFNSFLDTISELQVFPYGEINIKVIQDALKVFFSYGSNAYLNTIRYLVQQNPFFNTQSVKTLPTFERHILAGGLVGGFQGGMNYRIQISNRRIQNFSLFINDTLAMTKDTFFFPSGNRFIVIYDDLDIFDALAEMQLFFGHRINLDLSFTYNIFSPQTQEKAWHMPQYRGWFEFSYNIQKKFIPKFQALIIGDRYAMLKDRTIHLKPIFDLTFEFEYRYNEFLRGWFKLQNILARRYYYWHMFPSYKLQAFLGVSYIF